VLLFNYTAAIALQLRKSTKNISQFSLVTTELIVALTLLPLRDSLGWLAAHQFTSDTRGINLALGRHNCPPSFCKNKFPASTNFELKLSVRALMWSAKNGLHKCS
jgi:hypothetical protein